MIDRDDISGFMIMRDENGNIQLQVIADGSENMSVADIEAFNLDIAGMIDSLSVLLEVEGSLADTAVEVINDADFQEAIKDK